MSEPVFVEGTGHVHEVLSDYLNGDLSDAQREAVQAHLQSCAACRRDLDSLRLTVSLVRQLPLAPVPRSFAISVPERRRHAWLPWLRLSTGALAAVFVALLAVRLILPAALVEPGPPAPAGAAAGYAASRPAAPTVVAPAAVARPAAAPATGTPAAQTSAGVAAAGSVTGSASVASGREAAVRPSNAVPMRAAAAAARPPEVGATTPGAQPAPSPGLGAAATPSLPTSGTQSRPASAPTVSARVAVPRAAASLPAWLTAVQVAVGALVVASLALLVWSSRRL